jgi:hypothetical protein
MFAMSPTVTKIVIIAQLWASPQTEEKDVRLVNFQKCLTSTFIAYDSRISRSIYHFRLIFNRRSTRLFIHI